MQNKLSEDKDFLDCLQVGTAYNDQEKIFISSIQELEYKADLYDKLIACLERSSLVIGVRDLAKNQIYFFEGDDHRAALEQAINNTYE